MFNFYFINVHRFLVLVFLLITGNLLAQSKNDLREVVERLTLDSTRISLELEQSKVKGDSLSKFNEFLKGDLADCNKRISGLLSQNDSLVSDFQSRTEAIILLRDSFIRELRKAQYVNKALQKEIDSILIFQSFINWEIKQVELQFYVRGVEFDSDGKMLISLGALDNSYGIEGCDNLSGLDRVGDLLLQDCLPITIESLQSDNGENERYANWDNTAVFDVTLDIQQGRFPVKLGSGVGESSVYYQSVKCTNLTEIEFNHELSEP